MSYVENRLREIREMFVAVAPPAQPVPSEAPATPHEAAMDQWTGGPLTADRARELLRYNPFTGVFFWRVSRGSKAAWDIAGKMHSSGYSIIRIDGNEYRAHRLAWLYTYGEWPRGRLDHANGERDDNRIFANIRPADAYQNQYNRPAQANNTSGFKGVSKFSGKNLWRAEINVRGVRRYLGSFASPELAASAYAEAAAEMHGRFARIR